MNTEEAISRRRSIRKFTHDAIPQATLDALVEAARLAPSGCNSQPWRFKLASDAETKAKLRAAAAGQRFIESAPTVIVCCVDLRGYVEESCSTVKAMVEASDMKPEMADAMMKRTAGMAALSRTELAAGAAFNIGIAGEHIALRALDFGLGSCWVRAFDETKVREIFGWDENLYVVALLPIGVPAEQPPARRRFDAAKILL